MSKPCSQLNSKAIRDKAECEIVARVEKLCSIVSFKCVWRVDHQEIENAWNWICEKRDECDLILSKLSEVCFLFSAISTSQWDSKKRKKTERSQETRESGDSNDESPNTASQLSSPGKQTFPAISYWVACQTRNGSPINALKIQRAVGSCGLEFYISRASRKTNSVHLLNQLCQVLKDHKNPCLMRLVESSYQHCLRALQEELVVDDYEESQELSPTENVVRLRVVLDNFKQMLVASVLELRRAGLVLDTFGFDKNLPTTSQTTSDPPHKPLSCPITVLCNDVQLVMRKLNYAIYRGEVYKMTAKSKFTYQYLCSMKTFLHNLMGNEAFKDRLVQHIQRVLPILSEPESSVVPQLKIDRDLIEVQGGWFWSFSCGSFVQGIITESQKGVKTPRAFVDYDRLKDPDPRYFEEILRNSLSEDKIQQFCADFLALFRPKEHKQPVPCAIGSSDSGKTSLFAPVFQIVNLNRIARVTKQKNFNKAMIDSLTEVIFLDEAYPGLLDIDDWKIMCQGGFTSHDAKWKKAQGFHCSATMYITCQTEMDFGRDHNEAMDRRLHKYHFKSLAHVVPEANKWMKEHAMDIIVWAQYIAGGSPCSVAPVPVVHDNGLPEDELRNILNVSLIDEEVSESSQTGCAQESVAQLTHSSSESDADITDDGSDAVEIETLRREYAKAKEESVRQRQLKMLLNNSERTRQSNRRLSKTMRDHRLAHRRRTLVELGVVEQSEVSQLVTDADNPLPVDLERKQEKALEERHQLRVAQQQRENELKAKRAYSNPWLLNMEKDMAEHSKRVEQTRDSEERALMDSLLEVNGNKLRLFHEGQGTLGLQVAVEERKKMCLERGLVERGLVDCIRNVFSPLPVIVDAASSSTHQQLSASRMFTPPRSEDGIDEEEEMFITPKTPSYAQSFDALCPPSPCSFANTPRKRPRLAQSQLSKGQKKIDNFFVSQK